MRRGALVLAAMALALLLASGVAWALNIDRHRWSRHLEGNH
jgi:hypothetical protein